MYQSIVPHIPTVIWEQPLVRAAKIHARGGKIIDIHQVKFNGESEPPLLRDVGSSGVLNIRSSAIPAERLQDIYNKNSLESEVFYNDALSETRQARSNTFKSVVGVTATVASGLYSVAQHFNFRKAQNCIGHRGQHMTVDACESLQFQESKIQLRNEAISFGIVTPILAALAVVAVKMRLKHKIAAQQEFTKAALAICNAASCEPYVNQQAVPVPQPE